MAAEGQRFGPQHAEMWLRHLGSGWQIDPYLEELQAILRVLTAQREHLRVCDAASSCHPLHVSVAEAATAAEAVRVIHNPMPDDSHSLETTMRVSRKPGQLLSVIHVPVFATEVTATVTSTPQIGDRRAHVRVAWWKGVIVVDAKQERVVRLPREAELANREHRGRHVAAAGLDSA
jgi:hypothetical protein